MSLLCVCGVSGSYGQAATPSNPQTPMTPGAALKGAADIKEEKHDDLLQLDHIKHDAVAAAAAAANGQLDNSLGTTTPARASATAD